MNVRIGLAAFLFALSCLVSSAVFAQGYGGLGSTAEGFEVPSRLTQFQFPGDHGAHPGFRIDNSVRPDLLYPMDGISSLSESTIW